MKTLLRFILGIIILNINNAFAAIDTSYKIKWLEPRFLTLENLQLILFSIVVILLIYIFIKQIKIYKLNSKKNGK